MSDLNLRAPIWHPFTQHGLNVAPVAVARAEGAYLYAQDGRVIIDAISSWWVNLHGHGHPRIADAIAAQAGKLEQVIFAGFTHEPAETLARKLLELAPPGLSYAFFSDSGSTSVEVAIKMAVGCWHNRKRPRHKIIALEHAYHGDMFGAMSVGQRGLFNAAYETMLFEVAYLPFPERGREQRTVDALKTLLANEPDAFAALIIEPLVLGAGGMRMYSAEVLAEIASLCQRHDVFFIADEVMTGFGRTGTMFACEQARVTPDLMCLSKGLTGGFLPMGATLASTEIYDAFYSQDRAKTFFHSSSYTGNAIACAAAVANLEIFEMEPVAARIATLGERQVQHLAKFQDRPEIAEIRQTGTIAALELKASDAGYFAALGPKLNRFYLEKSVLLRPLGNVVYVLPPYCIAADALKQVYEAIDESLGLIGG
ncbi:MAG TPA: adenosylmethionine--8-amino-7-oxononanoate transaminase [Micropepsaceae bacterium]|nr:adenosylmethionine--8-amino-7-oxononanoate transaminase [Micropepsaceae bacterium]